MPKIEDNQENIETCLKHCKQCLTYPGIEGEALFCARGKSGAPKPKQGCNCGYCEVKKKYFCNGAYFCIEGACETD